MIASHNSFTYMKAKNLFVNLFSVFWRCQTLTIKDQYDYGVRVFDVRVYRINNQWGISHGCAKFKQYFNTLTNICEYFNYHCSRSIIRIYLEDNTKNGKNQETKNIFLKESEYIFNHYKYMIWEIGTHYPWITYYHNENFNPQIKEYYGHLLNWNPSKSIWYNLKHLDFSTLSLRNYSKKHNIPITQEMKNDDQTMYIFDHIGLNT